MILMFSKKKYKLGEYFRHYYHFSLKVKKYKYIINVHSMHK